MKREPDTYASAEPDADTAGFQSPLPARISEQERTPAMLIHLSPLVGMVLPAIGNLLGPLLAWLIYRDRSRLLDEQGKEALNFQISMWIYGTLVVTLLAVLGVLGVFGGVAAGAATGSDAAVGVGMFGGVSLIVLAGVVGLFFAVLPIIAMILAVISVSDGRPYRYPLTLRLLK